MCFLPTATAVCNLVSMDEHVSVSCLFPVEDVGGEPMDEEPINMVEKESVV